MSKTKNGVSPVLIFFIQEESSKGKAIVVELESSPPIFHPTVGILFRYFSGCRIDKCFKLLLHDDKFFLIILLLIYILLNGSTAIVVTVR